MGFISNINLRKLIIIYILYYYINKHVRQVDDGIFLLLKVNDKTLL